MLTYSKESYNSAQRCRYFLVYSRRALFDASCNDAIRGSHCLMDVAVALLAIRIFLDESCNGAIPGSHCLAEVAAMALFAIRISRWKLQ